MKRFLSITICLLLLVLMIQPVFNAQAAGSLPRHTNKKLNMDHVAGQVLVSVDKDTSKSVTKSLSKISYVEDVESIGMVKETSFKNVKIDGSVSPEKAADKIETIAGVKSASPNYIRKISYSTSDAKWPISTGKVDEAWNIGEAGDWLDNPATVAVLDTGIDLDHPDLVNKLWTNTGETEGDSIDNDSNGYVDDINGVNFTAISYFPADDYGNEYPLGSSSPDVSTKSIAQKITGNGSSISNIQLYVCRYGKPKKPVTVSIRSALDGPDLASGTISPNDIPYYWDEEFGGDYGEAFLNVTLSDSVSIDEDVPYYICLDCDLADFNNSYTFVGSENNTEENYAGGDLYIKQGSDWGPHLNSDLYFGTDASDNNVSDDEAVSHGTHVSGIIGAEHNGTGIAGVSKSAKIMPVKVGDKNGMVFDSSVISGIAYAADNGAKVINMSFGGEEDSDVLQDAITDAYDKGVVLIASAGNGGYGDIEYPAANAHVISVAASNVDNKLASFSTNNEYVDVTAPGEEITSTVNNGLYDTLSGTSMSAPYVSGLAALLIAQHPDWSPDRIENRIETTSTDMTDFGEKFTYNGKDIFTGWGLVNALEAVGSTESTSISQINTITAQYGKKSSISGYLRGDGWPPSTGLNGKTLQLWEIDPMYQSIGLLAPYSVQDTLLTGSTGYFSTKLPSLFQNTKMRLTWAGDDDNERISTDFDVNVKPLARLRSSNYRLKRGKVAFLNGSVIPADGNKHVIKIKRSRDRIHWTTLKTKKLTGTQYKLAIRPSRTYYYRTYFLRGQECHYQTTSNTIKISVRNH